MDKKDGPIDLESLRGFTPGPWSLPHFAEPEACCSCKYVLTDSMLGAVCSVHCSGDGDWKDTGDNPKFDEAVANAHLIAAAPSMHAELTARRARDAEAVRRQDMTTNDKLADALRNLIRAGKHLRNTVVETRGVAGMDDHDVAISDSIAALAEHDAQPAPEL